MQQLQMVLLRSWRWRTKLDYEEPNLPQSAGGRICLYVWRTASGSTVFGLPDLGWSSRFLQSDQNFLNHLVVCCDQLHFYFSHYMFRVASAVLRPSSNSHSKSFQIKPCCIFIIFCYFTHRTKHFTTFYNITTTEMTRSSGNLRRLLRSHDTCTADDERR